VAFAATGRQPYGTGTYQTIFFRVLQGQAELDGVPPALLPVVAAALAVDPRDRPPAAWLAEHCALLQLDGASSPAAAGPNGTRLTSVAVPWWPEHPEASAAQAAGFRFGPAGPAGSAGPAAPPAPLMPSAYRGPAEVAADMADLLPPVDYSRRGVPAAPAAPVPAPPGNSGPPPRGQGLVLQAFGVAAVALSVLLPVAGTVLALAVIALLRAADRAQTGLEARRSARGARPSDIVIVVVTAPWTVVRALLTMVALAPLAVLFAGAAAAASVAFAQTRTLPAAGSWAAGAAVAMYAIGPGSRSPRRQLRRMSATVIRSRASLLVALIAAWALAAAVISSALSQPPLIWPATSWMLPHVLPSMGGTLHSIQKWLLGHTVGMLHLP
jgi:hypothetical protein